MNNTSYKKILVPGLIAMIVLQACVIWIWRNSESEHAQRLSRIANEQREQQIIFKMRDAAHNRALSLFRMAQLDDPFDRDSERIKLSLYASDFIRARDDLVSHQSSSENQDDPDLLTWEVIRPVISKSAEVLNLAAETLQRGEFEKAREILTKAVIPAQESVMSILTKKFDTADVLVKKYLEAERETSQTMSTVVLLLGGGALAITLAIGIFVVVRTARAEQTLVKQSLHMESLKDQAESSSRAKSSFLANMSHEIRTPLTAIIGFSESLLEPQCSPSDRLNATHTIIRCGKHLLRVINDILDLSKIEADKLSIEKMPVDLFQIVDEVRALASVQAEGKGIAYNVEFKFPVPAKIDSDPVRIKQILFNLVSNAIKFTQSGGVRVRIGYDVARNILKFEVIDTGIGLSDAQQNKLFTAFNQADTTTSRKFGGTGLGLHLSRTLCRKLGGDITVLSTEGVGSIFTARIDAGETARNTLTTLIPSAPENVQTPIAEVHGSGAVLLADDVAENRQLISLYLRRIGVTVTCAENGLQAVNLALDSPFNLILMDMQMPVMDGLEATRLLRSRGYTHPIVALTANVMKEEIDQCIESGCNGFIGKPINRSEFNEVVLQHLNSSTTMKFNSPATH